MASFFLIHGLVSLRNKVAERDGTLRIKPGHADTEREFVARFTCVRLLDTLFQSAEQNFPGLAGSFERQYDEFISTEASHNVRITECAFQGICSADQREISQIGRASCRERV